MKNIKHIIQLLIALLPAAVYATPQISSVTGTFIHGSTVTIGGSNMYDVTSGIQSKSPVAPLVWDDCEGTNILISAGGLWDEKNPNNSAAGSEHDIAYRTSPYTSDGTGPAVSAPHARSTKFLAGGHSDICDEGLTYGGYNVGVTKVGTDMTNGHETWFGSWYERADPNWPSCGAHENYKLGMIQDGTKYDSPWPETGDNTEFVYWGGIDPCEHAASSWGSMTGIRFPCDIRATGTIDSTYTADTYSYVVDNEANFVSAGVVRYITDLKDLSDNVNSPEFTGVNEVVNATTLRVANGSVLQEGDEYIAYDNPDANHTLEDSSLTYALDASQNWFRHETHFYHGYQDDGYVKLFLDNHLVWEPRRSQQSPPNDTCSTPTGAWYTFAYGTTDKIRSYSVGGFYRHDYCNEDGSGGSRGWDADAWRYFDDIYIDTTMARVVLGNANTLAGSSVRSMQIPQNTFSDTSIEIKVNLGALTSNTGYLYVCDVNNICNTDGYPVTLYQQEGLHFEGGARSKRHEDGPNF